MAMPSEMSLEEIRNYLLENGGTARNHDLVKHFKQFLMDPETRVEARNRFKEYVNTLATMKNEEGEKYLVLKKKYRQPSLDLSSSPQVESSFATPDLDTPISPLREPPPYRSPPPASASPLSAGNSQGSALTLVLEQRKDDKSNDSESDASASSPPVPPRRKSQEKLRVESKESAEKIQQPELSQVAIEEDEATDEATTNAFSDELLSVRERTEHFNRMASESDVGMKSASDVNGTNGDADEDDSASVDSQFEGKSREWLVRMAQGDYQALAKLASQEPRLARFKDPSSGYTALHWAAKHGNEDIVKLIAGAYKKYIKSVDEITNMGYTALHIAMMFGHENVFNLLVQVYGANQEIRDFSGRKPRQYLISQTAVSQDTFDKINARKEYAERDLGFLRIGSLNVRVRRTTEAFSQLWGVASSSSSSSIEKIHKLWASADNVQLSHKFMLPPTSASVKKRRSKMSEDFGSSQDRGQQVASEPTTPLLQDKVSRSKRDIRRRQTYTSPSGSSFIGSFNIQQSGNSDSDSDSDSRSDSDSDLDTACGFDSTWQGSNQQ